MTNMPSFYKLDIMQICHVHRWEVTLHHHANKFVELQVRPKNMVIVFKMN